MKLNIEENKIKNNKNQEKIYILYHIICLKDIIDNTDNANIFKYLYIKKESIDTIIDECNITERTLYNYRLKFVTYYNKLFN